MSVDQLANLHSVSLRYLVTSRVKVRRKKNDGDTPSIMCGEAYNCAFSTPVNPNRAWLITCMYHNVENAGGNA